jgi:DHA1 family bicyclomycin/chloramphenicol resistance-like MFS transporter
MQKPLQQVPDHTVGAGPRGRLVLLLIAMTSISPLSLNILAPAVPALITTLSADAGAVQLTISLYLVGLAVSQLVLGPLSDRFGRRPVILAGLALTTIASIAAMAVSTIGGLIVARLVQSFGASTGMVVGRAIIRDLVDRERAASTIGLVTTAMVVIPMITPLIGGILDTAFGWKAIFIFVAVCSGSVLVWAAIVLPETRIVRGGEGGFARYRSDIKALAKSPSFNAYMLVGAFTSASYFVFLGGVPHVVVALMGRTSAEYGIWFAIASVGYMAGNFFASRFSIRYGVDTMIWFGMWFQLASCLLAIVLAEYFLHLGPIVLFVPQLFISLGNGISLPNAIAGAVSVRPDASGTASGLSGFVQMGVGAALAQFGGWAVVVTASVMPMTISMAVLTAMALAAFGLLIRRARSGTATPL